MPALPCLARIAMPMTTSSSFLAHTREILVFSDFSEKKHFDFSQKKTNTGKSWIPPRRKAFFPGGSAGSFDNGFDEGFHHGELMMVTRDGWRMYHERTMMRDDENVHHAKDGFHGDTVICSRFMFLAAKALRH